MPRCTDSRGRGSPEITDGQTLCDGVSDRCQIWPEVQPTVAHERSVWSGGCRIGVPSAAGQLCIDSLPSEGRLDRGDVDLVHGHHRVEGAFGRCVVRAGGGVE